VVLQDLDVHGLTGHGIIGPLGGALTLSRVRLGYNAEAGWDLDDGDGTASVNGSITASSLVVEWSGCNEEYPLVDAFPAISCYDDNSAGYGDGLGTPATPLDFHCDRCTFRNNTQDGLDLSHASANEVIVTDSAFYANMGQQLTLGAATQAALQNDLFVTNCNRMSAPFTGAPSTFNQHLSDYCRASGDGLALILGDGETLRLQNDSFVGYSATLFDIGCSSASCPTASIVYENNLVRGYASATYNGGQQPGAFYLGTGISASIFGSRDHDLFFGTRNDGCPSTGYPDESCVDPAFVNEPATFATEATLDGFDFGLDPQSPARGAGVFLPTLITDYADDARANPPSIGALEGAAGGAL